VSYSYIILGAGRQGTAAAYDLALFGDAERVTLADMNLTQAERAARHVNRLTGLNLADAITLDARDLCATVSTLSEYHVLLSAVPYYFNLDLTRAAIEAGVSMCDLGGNTDLVRQQHALDAEARQAGVRIIPDCGMGPGMGNTLAVYAMGLLDACEHIYILDGGLPQEPQLPWNYQASFSIEGLTNEYYGGLTVLRDGELVSLPVFSEMEIIQHPVLGPLEAFVAAGGLSTAPWTFQGKLKTFQLKIVRYPGTYAHLKAYADLGLYDLEPVLVNGAPVVPRHLFHALYEPKVRAEVVKDVCMIRVLALGSKNGHPAEVTIDLVDRYDPLTGFSSMERTTGWHASIVAAMIARGETPIGAVPLEIAVPGDRFVQEAKLRGFKISEEIKI